MPPSVSFLIIIKCHSLFFIINLQAWPATILKKRPWHRCLAVNFAKFLRTPFNIEQLWWLLLKIKMFTLALFIFEKSKVNKNKSSFDALFKNKQNLFVEFSKFFYSFVSWHLLMLVSFE